MKNYKFTILITIIFIGALFGCSREISGPEVNISPTLAGISGSLEYAVPEEKLVYVFRMNTNDEFIDPGDDALLELFRMIMDARLYI
jgi:hypothetical protein